MPDDKLGYTVNRLVNDYGWSPQAAAGIAANIGHESEFKTNALGDGGASMGLAQWNGGRRTALINYASKNGRRVDDLDTQLDFLHHELHTEYPSVASKLRDALSEADATRIFSQGYEKPGKPMMQSRLSWAQKAMKAIGPSEAVASEDTVVEEPWPLKRKSSGTSVSSEEPWHIKGKNVGGEELWPIKKAGESTPTAGPDVESNTSEWESLKSTPSIIWNGAEAGFANRISQLAAAGTGMMGGGNARVFGYDMPDVSQKEAQEAVFKELIKNVKPPDDTYIGKILYGAGSALPDLLVMGLVSPIAGAASSQVGNALLQKVVHGATTFGTMGALSAEPVKETLKGIVAGGVLGGIPGSWNLLSRVGSGAGIGVSLTALENQMEGKPQELKDLVAASVLMGFFAGLPQGSKQGMSKEEIAALNKMQTEVQARRKELFEQGIALPEEKLGKSKVEYETDPGSKEFQTITGRVQQPAAALSRAEIEAGQMKGADEPPIPSTKVFPSKEAQQEPMPADRTAPELRRPDPSVYGPEGEMLKAEGIEVPKVEKEVPLAKKADREAELERLYQQKYGVPEARTAEVQKAYELTPKETIGREDVGPQLATEPVPMKSAEESARVFAKEELEFESLLKSPRGKDDLAAQLAAEEAASILSGGKTLQELDKPLQPWLLTPEQARQRLSMATGEQGTVKDPFPGTPLTDFDITRFQARGDRIPTAVNNLEAFASSPEAKKGNSPDTLTLMSQLGKFLRGESGQVDPGWELDTFKKFQQHLRDNYGKEGEQLANALNKGAALAGQLGDQYRQFRKDELAKLEMAPTFYSPMQQFLDVPGRVGKAQNAKLLAKQLGDWSKKGMVSEEELKWSGIRQWLESKEGKVTKAEVEEFLRQNQVRVEEVQKGIGPGSKELTDQQLRRGLEEYAGEDTSGLSRNELLELFQEHADAADNTGRAMLYESAGRSEANVKFSQWQEPGGENYRELLLTLPPKEIPVMSFEAYIKSTTGKDISELSPKAIEVKRRLYERDPGRLETEKRREDTFKSGHWNEPNVLASIRFNDRTGPNGERILFLEEVQSDWHQKGRKEGYRGEAISDALKKYQELPRDPSTWSGDNLREAGLSIQEISNVMDHFNEQPYGIPAAPFSKTWPELAMKRMIRYAAENGYDKLAWTTGEMQAKRYDLSKQVDKIISYKMPGEKYQIEAVKDGQKVMPATDYPAGKLADVVGKDLADKILSSGDGVKNWTGPDLKVGGEGMKGFYDKILPSFASKYGKQWGARVREENIGPALKSHSLDVTPKMREEVLYRGQKMFPGEGGLDVPSVLGNLKNFLKDESGTVSPGWELQTLRKFTDHLRSEYGEDGKKLADWLSKGGAFTSESAALFKKFRDQQAEQEVRDIPKPEVQRMVQLRPYEEAQVGRISKALEGTVLSEMRQLVPALKESVASGQTTALEAAKMLIRSYSAGRRNELARVDLELKRFNKDFKWADNKEFLRLLKEDVSNYQSGKGVSPAIRGLLEKYDQLRKPYEEFMAEHSPGWEGKDHYFREMFKPPREGWEKWFYSNKTSFDGPRGFLKESKYATWADGLAKGLEPRKSNILDLIRTDLMEKDQFMKGHQLAGLFEEMGVLNRLPAGETLPQGMLPIRGAFGSLNYKDVKTGEMVVGGTYIADRNVANLISGQLEPGLMAAIDNSVANPALRLGAKVAAKGWIGASNTLRMIEVFGMHHAYATDNHVRAIIAGNIPWHVVTSVMGGTTDAVKAMTPGFSIALNNKVAKGLQDAWLTKKGSTEMQDGVFNIIQGGGNINAHPEKIVRGWMEGTAPEYGNALKDALIDISHDIKDLRIGSALKETAHGISAPIMSYLVPDAKVSVFHLVNKQPMDALRAKYEVTGIGKDARTRNPVDQKQFEVERLKLNQDHWKFVDYSFGQIPRENMMMRNTWKDLMNFAIQFPGWNIGTFKLMGYAASGTVKNLAIKPALYAPGIKGSKISQSQLLKSNQLENQAARMALGLALTQGITGTIIYRVLNGQWPETIKDMFLPLITREDADKGIKEERAMLPGYLKSGLAMAHHPLSSVAGLQNHMITAMQELYANKRSYASSYIRTPGASMTQQTEEVAMDLASRFRPFFMSQQEKGQTWLGKYGSWVGLYPASKLIAAEPDERMLMEQGSKHQTIRTPAEEKVNKLKNNIIKEAKQGNKEEAKKLLREGLTEGTLDPDKVEKWKIETGLTQRQVRFKNVPLEMMLQVYDKASESHRKEYVNFMVKKLSNATPKELKDYKKDILRFKDDIKSAIAEGALDE